MSTLILFSALLIAAAIFPSPVAAQLAALQRATPPVNVHWGPWTYADTCCAGCGYDSGCCCARRRVVTSWHTSTARRTVTRTRWTTATRTTTIFARNRVGTGRIPGVARLRPAQLPAWTNGSLGALEQEEAERRLYARHLCPSCPSGVPVARVRGRAARFCCPERSTVTSTQTRTAVVATKTVRRTTTSIVTLTAVAGGQLFIDVTGTGTYQPGDIPQVGVPLQLQCPMATTRAAGMEVVCNCVTGANGLFVFACPPSASMPPGSVCLVVPGSGGQPSSSDPVGSLPIDFQGAPPPFNQVRPFPIPLATSSTSAGRPTSSASKSATAATPTSDGTTSRTTRTQVRHPTRTTESTLSGTLTSSTHSESVTPSTSSRTVTASQSLTATTSDTRSLTATTSKSGSMTATTSESQSLTATTSITQSLTADTSKTASATVTSSTFSESLTSSTSSDTLTSSSSSETCTSSTLSETATSSTLSQTPTSSTSSESLTSSTLSYTPTTTESHSLTRTASLATTTSACIGICVPQPGGGCICVITWSLTSSSTTIFLSTTSTAELPTSTTVWTPSTTETATRHVVLAHNQRPRVRRASLSERGHVRQPSRRLHLRVPARIRGVRLRDGRDEHFGDRDKHVRNGHQRLRDGNEHVGDGDDLGNGYELDRSRNCARLGLRFRSVPERRYLRRSRRRKLLVRVSVEFHGNQLRDRHQDHLREPLLR